MHYMYPSIRGASFKAKDINNHTPIMRAIACGHQSVVEMFLEFGCSVDSVVRHQKTLLEWAIENEYNVLIEVARYIRYSTITTQYNTLIPQIKGKSQCINLISHWLWNVNEFKCATCFVSHVSAFQKLSQCFDAGNETIPLFYLVF